MAEEIKFLHHDILRSESLGSGAYGAVYKARCDSLLCAAKIMHPNLVISSAEQHIRPEMLHRLPIMRFYSECRFMNALRHPNIVQYLGTCQDSETNLPVLLMELMDGNLTSFLNDSDTTLPLHTQVSICHDIAQALSFLHSNSIIHRDLSSNNILMIGDKRAKVTDFGMARLFSRDDLTSNPGTEVYMPPEAKESSYNTGIDCFSYGVLVIQTITLLYPKPGDKFVPVEGGKDFHKKVSEVQRRQNHIELIESEHPLLPLALECLGEEEGERPRAQELCSQLETVRNSKQFSDSKRDCDLVRENRRLKETIEAMKRQCAEEISTLKQCHSKEIQDLVEQTKKEFLNLKDSHASKMTEIQALHKNEIGRLQEVVKSLEEEMKFHQHTYYHDLMKLKQSHTLELESVEEEKVEWKQKRDYIHHELITKQEEVLKLQKQVRDMEGSFEKRRAAGDRHPVQDMKVAVANGRKPSLIINWKPNEMPAPLALYREDSEAVFCNETLYVRPGSRRVVLAFKPKLNMWREMPKCPHKHATLTHIDKTVLAIGGRTDSMNSLNYLNSIFYLTDEGGECRWEEADFRLRTKRCSVLAVNTGTWLVVAGGEGEGLRLKKVEVIDISAPASISTRAWQVAADLPESLIFSSGTFSQGHIYFLGGEMGYNGVERNLMVSCSIDQLLGSRIKAPHKRRGSDPPLNIWSKISGPPVTQSACVAYRGRILSMGGKGEDQRPTSAVYGFNADTNSWSRLVSGYMNMTRSKCFAVVLPGDHKEEEEAQQLQENDKILVVGGHTNAGKTDTLETGTLLLDTVHASY